MLRLEVRVTLEEGEEAVGEEEEGGSPGGCVEVVLPCWGDTLAEAHWHYLKTVLWNMALQDSWCSAQVDVALWVLVQNGS